MTIAICLKVGDGVILGTDSASSLISDNDRYFNVYNTAEKTFNLVKGLPIGMMSFGLGGMAGLSIGTLARELRHRLSGEDPLHPEWAIDPRAYTIEQVARRVKEFFYDELYQAEFGPLPAMAPAQGVIGSDDPHDGEVEGTPGEKAPEFPLLGLWLLAFPQMTTIRRFGRCR